MFSTRSLRLRPSLHSSLRLSPTRTPSNKRFFIQSINEGFLDLALALPYPAHWPAYSTTIILLTVVARTAVLPAVFWATRRQSRYERNVLPVLRELKPIVMHEQAIAMRKEGLLENKELRAEIHAKRCHEIMKTRSKELEKTYRCKPLITSLIPAMAQAPLFIAMTMVFARLAADPISPFDSESFLTLSSLDHPDPTFTLPVVVGLLTMANVESSHWVLNPTERDMVKENEKKMKEAVEKSGDKWSKLSFKLKSNMKDSMRVLSILRIGLAAVAPGAVTLYWVTSAAYGLFQTWLVNWLAVRKRRQWLATSPPNPRVTVDSQKQTLGAIPLAYAQPSSGSGTALSSLKSDSSPLSEKSKRSLKGKTTSPK
ncbi:60Kd inner membrane protein-domain-containing protein [Lentinula raphanica]|uniref:60Kd inner membrane protein-domain-containing protein n=1 Tax=Lentinula raphanica TaxID=153919 RepID=A0AA38ULT6_9AGAR|nr:60Kd inner membrane protein-domain-containing protein [Lentinula raphanica]KAJ3843392.1 60Kd inner membrane protein-domain-containing protein [Lentinula raphanica]